MDEIPWMAPKAVPKPKATYSNGFYPTNLSNTPKLIYELGERFRQQQVENYDPEATYSYDSKLRGNSVLFTKKFYLDYLAANRNGESLGGPDIANPFWPRVQLSQETIHGVTIDFVHVDKLNEKHKGKHLSQQLPIDNDYEASMWKYIVGKSREEFMATETVLDFSALGGYSNRTQITKYMKNHFKVTLTDGTTVYRNAGLVPHILRHLRVYNMLVEKGWRESTVQSFLGWTSRDMLQYYVYIERQLSKDAQMKMLKSDIRFEETPAKYH